MRYLLSAFLVRPPFALRLPVFALLALAGTGIAMAWPLIGLPILAGVAALVLAISAMPAFRTWVDAGAVRLAPARSQATPAAHEAVQDDLIASLPPESAARERAFARACAEVIDILTRGGRDVLAIEDQREALRRLRWIHLKLLIARLALLRQNGGETAAQLAGRLAVLDGELADPSLPAEVRTSRGATRALLAQRLANRSERDGQLAGVESDLTRVRVQLDLARENAGKPDPPLAVADGLDLVSNLLDGGLFGDAGGAVARVERGLAATAKASSG